MSASHPSPKGGLLVRLTQVSTTSLADASKATKPLRMVAPELRPVREGLSFVGRAVTVDASEGLLSMVAALAASGPDDVLVVAGHTAGAVSGELFASEALRRGVRALVIDGFCRDRATLAGMDLPVYARGSVPNAPGTDALPVTGTEVTIGGVLVRPGEILVGDDDGIVVGSVDELTAVIEAAESIEAYETSLRSAIQEGSSLLDHLNYEEHVAALRAGRPSKLTFS